MGNIKKFEEFINENFKNKEIEATKEYQNKINNGKNINQISMSASSGSKTWKGQEVYNEIGTLWTKVSGKGGSAILLTATYNSCDGVKWMWRLEGMSGWFREGGYMSDTEQDAFNKGIEYCKENGYNIIKM